MYSLAYWEVSFNFKIYFQRLSSIFIAFVIDPNRVCFTSFIRQVDNFLEEQRGIAGEGIIRRDLEAVESKLFVLSMDCDIEEIEFSGNGIFLCFF